MIIRDAIRGLRYDLPRTFFYWFTFFLTSTFIYLFFNVLMCDPQARNFLTNAEDTGTTFVIIAVVVICLACIQFANDFYVRAKGKDIAVRLICGATFTQLAGYLLTQTIIILLLALPPGILLAHLLMPVLTKVMQAKFQTDYVIQANPDAVMMIVTILGMEVAWFTAVNMSFAYTNSAAVMMNKGTGITSKQGDSFGSLTSKMPQWISAAFWVIFLIGMFVLGFVSEIPVIFTSLFALLGLNGMINNAVIPLMNYDLTHNSLNHPIKLAGKGFVKRDIIQLKNTIILLAASAALLLSLIVTKTDKPLQMILFTMTFVVMNVLLSLMILFKNSTEQSTREPYFNAMFRLGYMKSDLNRVVFNETSFFYGITALIAAGYSLFILLGMIHKGLITLRFSILLIVIILVPLFISYLINMVWYKKTVLKNVGEPK